MVWRSLYDIAFDDKKTTFGWREQLMKSKKYEIKKIIIVLKSKKMFVFEKFDKNIQLV